MNAHIDFKVTEENGERYAMVPFEQFQALVGAFDPDNLSMPHEVVGRHLIDKVPLIKAWREYLGLTQDELAKRLAVSQAQIAQWERPGANLRHATLKKVATAMRLHIGQLMLDDDKPAAV